jgi:hypothetical protein
VSGRRKVRWDVSLVVASSLALTIVLGFLGAGISPERLWPVAGFLAISTSSAAFMTLANRALRRRMLRLRASVVPRGVWLRKPIWIQLNNLCSVLAPAAMLGALVAGIGFPQVGVGILLMLGGMISLMPLAPDEPRRGLTFHDLGLRLHLRSGECHLPWSLITGLEVIGPDHCQMVRVSILEIDPVIESVSPNTPGNRRRARVAFGGSGDQAELLMFPWTAGLDGQTLERAIREAMTGRPDRMN